MDDSPPRTPPEPRVAGPFLLFGPIAEGRERTVNFGRWLDETGNARTVAVKQQRPPRHEASEDALLAESLALCAIRHPHFVRRLSAAHVGGRALVAEEYVHGESLARLLAAARARGVILPFGVAVTVGTSVLHALSALGTATDPEGRPLRFARGEIAPPGVLVGADGVVRLLDAGAPTAPGKAAGPATRDTEPELPGDVARVVRDPRADVYAAGRILQAMIGGAPSFAGVLRQSLDVNPARRYPSPDAMAAALAKCAPAATPEQVARWVDMLAGEALATRASIVRGIERYLPGADAGGRRRSVPPPLYMAAATPSSPSVAPPPAAARTEEPTVRLQRRRSRASAVLLVTLGALLSAAVGLGIGTVVRTRRAPAATSTGVSVFSATMRAPAPAAEANAEAAPLVPSQLRAPDRAIEELRHIEIDEPPASVATAPAQSTLRAAPAQSTLRAAPAQSTAVRASIAAPRRPPAASRARASAVKCDPPFTVDDRGLKHYKLECL